MTQVKKDANQHGTYSVNPFAMYPKHLKNTISSLLQSNAATLISTKELQKNFDNAFIDLEKREKEMKNQDMKIREKQLQLEQAEKKRYYVS
jgi:CMP-N-acetylneuraminic acid synthetase